MAVFPELSRHVRFIPFVFIPFVSPGVVLSARARVRRVRCRCARLIAELERIVVSANRMEQPLSRIGDSVTLIDAEEVRASQKPTVSDLLATTPGITVSRNGGLGGSTQLRIRGAESDQTVVLIDGVKLNDPSSAGGGFNFAQPADRRLHAHRSAARSAVDAVGQPGDRRRRQHRHDRSRRSAAGTSYSAEGGSRGSATVQARAEAGGERVSWRVAGKYLTTDGISAFNDDRGGQRARRLSQRRRQRARDWCGSTMPFPPSCARRTAAAASTSTASPRRRSRSPTRASTATRDELVAYAGVNATTFGGQLQNRVGFAYTDTDRENIDPDSRVPTTFDATRPQRALGIPGHADAQRQHRRGVRPGVRALRARHALAVASSIRTRRRSRTTRVSTASTRKSPSRRSTLSR